MRSGKTPGLSGPMTRGTPASAARRVLAVAALTFREARRRWVVIAAFVMTLGMLALYGVGLYFAGRELRGASASVGSVPSGLMRNIIASQLLYMGLFLASIIVGFIAVFASVGSISSELDTGVLYGILTRPIRRSELLIGKFLGIGAMLAVYAVVLNGVIVGLARWFLRAPVRGVPGGFALLVLEPTVLLAIALLGSTRLPTIANGVMCATAFGISFIGGVIEQIGSLINNQAMMNAGILSSLLMPFDAIHRKALSLLVPASIASAGQTGMGFAPSATPSAWMIAYAAAYPVLAIWIAVRAFGRRDL